ncbi:contractile injection system tape measure protein [Chryseobacterium echinoideorum]|uniref:contractile injection system tape measure protein n=1 Tax=Chryseobacterium echinoideorum TaxID=1549648 RepID=UPI0011853737|nr:contractile injection system tape measure protein [Chryseobacterium echinoideorum]
MKQDHIIQKVFIEISVNNKEKALSIKDDINNFLSMDVFPKIEKYINDLEHQFDDSTLQIPKLELNLNTKNSALNSELKDKILQVFEEEFSEITNSILNSDQKTENKYEAYLIENQEKIVQTFIYFLTTGSIPWWNSGKNSISFLEPEVFNRMILAENFKRNIIPAFSDQNMKERIINQLSNEQIAQLCLVVLKDTEFKINLEKNAVKVISKLNYNNRNLLWEIVLNGLSEYLKSSSSDLKKYLLQQIQEKTSSDLLLSKKIQQTWKTIVEIFPFIKEDESFESIENSRESNSESALISTEQKNRVIKDELKKTEEYLNQKDDLISNDEQYIQNAGLILIHPFLKTFFEHCDLFDSKNNRLLNPELCAHLLHYIATGKTNAPEYDMAFEKFLCNIPSHQTINRHIKLTRKHKTQAENVIESVQHNWSAMKKSSIALLQNEFFQRPGKLVIDHDYTLTVERKTQDILLEKLGWGIGLVKLPWQEKFIFINW